ncbi:MAG: hypothetical protein NTU48_07105 [Legionellales bacterium]|nr:hypothetical protein [Legionellales bacterium]
MSQMKSCIIVLKPTSFFTSFVIEQLPDFDCPNEEDLESDYTAYTLPVCDSDDALLEHLERLFPFMFRHEVTRLLGKNLATKIKADFLDFLCCFKFEVHSHSVLMESSIQDCHQLVCVKPRVVDLEWLQESDDQIEVRGILHALNTSQTGQTASLLVRHYDRLADLKPLVQRYCRPLLKQDFMKKAAQLIQWPSVSSLQMFHRYFAVEVHTQVVHLH